MKNRLTILIFAGCLLCPIFFGATLPAQQVDFTGADLIMAAQKNDLELVKKILAAGVDVNSKNAYDATAVLYACGTGNVELVKTLLEAGANPNVTETFYNFSALGKAGSNMQIKMLLLKHGLSGPDNYLIEACLGKKTDLAKAAIDSGKIPPARLALAKHLATTKEADDIVDLFKDIELPELDITELDQEAMKKYGGKFEGDDIKANVVVEEERLVIEFASGYRLKVKPVTEGEFVSRRQLASFEVDGDQVKSLRVKFGGDIKMLKRAATDDIAEMPGEAEKVADANEPETNPKNAEAAEAEPEFGPSSPESLAMDREISSVNWPGFRGNGSRGVAEGQKPPLKWNVDERENVRWKIPLPGLSNSCPTVWGNRLFITTAVSSKDSGEFKIGLYGDVSSVEDDSVYNFDIYCVNKNTGDLIWRKTAHQSSPAVKRHAKSSHANPTIATDGKYLIAFFGSEGLFCYTVDGDFVWKQDFGVLDSGWFHDATFQWGFGASPIIFDGKVLVQCDIQQRSFVAALDLKTGNQVWRTKREEIPTWSSPIVHTFGDLPMLITQGTRAARGYDARNGALLWSLPKQSEIAVPTPFVAHGLIYIASGYHPIRPVYAIRPSARGEIELEEGETSSEHIAWSLPSGGPYMPTPVVYGDYLYICSNEGILTCFDAKDGTSVYKKRLRAKGGGLSFTGSPIAGDGHIYFPSEDGRVLVVKAGPNFEIVETNHLNDNLLSTPAISEGTMFFRTQKSLIAIGETDTTQ